MSVERSDKPAKGFLILLIASSLVGFVCWLGFKSAIGAVALFQVFHDKSSVLVGLTSAPALVGGLSLEQAGNRRYKATAVACFLTAFLALLLIIMTPLDSVLPEAGESVSPWVLYLPSFFFWGVFAMVGSFMMALRAHIFEGEGEVIPYPTSKSDAER